MKNSAIAIALILLMVSCGRDDMEKAFHLPSEEYKFTEVDTAKAPTRSTFYVPIYSHIYLLNGTRRINLAATLSVRHTTFADTVYVTKVDYYSGSGKLLKKYIDKPLLLEPMHSVEFVVAESEDQGGAGANFMVECRTKEGVADPLVQAVMVTSYNASGISFTTEGIKQK